MLLASVWLLVHWVVVSSYSNWWGGWCFGNRMFADAVPAVIVVTVAVGRSWLASGHRSLASLVLLGALGTASVYIHSVRGLYDRDSFNWCRDGTYVSHLFDWHHPQWLASPKSRARHYRAHLLPTVPLHAIDDPVLPDSSDVLFESWFRHEGGGAWRWSDGIESTILLRLDARRFPPSGRLRVGLSFDTFGPQEVTIAVNGRAAAVTSGAAVGRIETIRFDSDLAGLGAIDEDGGLPLEIAFSTPDAKSPASLDPKGRGDRRVLGVSLRRIDLGVEPPT